MNAIIQSGSKQYRVQVGDTIEVEKLGQEISGKVSFPVLLIEEGEAVKLGRPHLEGASVEGEILTQKKAKRVISYIYRRRKSSERKVGHRQSLTVVKITNIKA